MSVKVRHGAAGRRTQAWQSAEANTADSLQRDDIGNGKVPEAATANPSASLSSIGRVPGRLIPWHGVVLRMVLLGGDGQQMLGNGVTPY